VLQRAILMLLESIYEQDFHKGSYGHNPGSWRPKRSPHQAMDALWKETMRIGGGWILEVDLRKPPMPAERAILWFTLTSGNWLSYASAELPILQK